MEYYTLKKSIMNKISDDPVNHFGWYWNSPFECTKSVYRLSFYLRTIIKTCLAHLKEHLPILPANVVSHICDYADNNVFIDTHFMESYLHSKGPVREPAMISTLEHTF